MALNDEMDLILRYFIEFDSFRAHFVKVVDKAITIDNLYTITISIVVNVWRGTTRRPRYQYSITRPTR